MKPDPSLESVVKVAALLEEKIDHNSFDAALNELKVNPALMGSLTAVQFVKDAIRGNPGPDKRYTTGIMQFIAEAEVRRIADENSDK